MRYPQPKTIWTEHGKLARRVAALEKRMSRWLYVIPIAPADAPEDYVAGEPLYPSFQNGWANIGGGLAPMRFRSLPGGALEIQGSVGGGGDGTVIFTLPTAYRPSHNLRLPASADDGSFVVFQVLSTGDVIYGV
jgi:hypothetical protein